jgi:hypothetical protein
MAVLLAKALMPPSAAVTLLLHSHGWEQESARKGGTSKEETHKLLLVAPSKSSEDSTTSEKERSYRRCCQTCLPTRKCGSNYSSGQWTLGISSMPVSTWMVSLSSRPSSNGSKTGPTTSVLERTKAGPIRLSTSPSRWPIPAHQRPS